MKIETITVKNLRSIDECSVSLDDYTCLVGPNGAGKSTLLCALNIFFREAENAPTETGALSAADFHCDNTSEPIEITVTFTDLSSEAKDDFSEYVRHGNLVISAVATFDSASGKAEVRQYGERLVMPEFGDFFKAVGDREPVAALKRRFEDLEKNIPELAALKSAKTKDAMCETLHSFEEQRPEQCQLRRSEDQFYGISKGTNRLEKYVQWVFVPAVKDASDEQFEKKDGALGKLLARTVRAKVNFASDVEALLAHARERYQTMLKQQQGALDEVSIALGKRIAEWAHPDAGIRVEWKLDATKAVRVDPPMAGIVAIESGFEGDIVRFGHGFQRSYLLALLQELATSDDKDAPRLILGCEEPELYQHPPQARHLASVLEKLSTANSQIVITTHSPYFVSGRNFENTRVVRRKQETKCTDYRDFTWQALATRFAAVTGQTLLRDSGAMAKLHQALQPVLNEMFFTQRLILVEGLEDVAYIHSWLVLSDRWEEYRRTGCHIVPVGGKSEMIRPAIIAQGLKIPTFAVFDSDGDQIGDPERRRPHERDNKALLRLFGGDDSNLFPTGVIFGDRFATWPDDIGETFKRECIAAIGVQAKDRFENLQNKSRAKYGNAGSLNKDTLYIGDLLSRIHDLGITPPSLDQLCSNILKFDGIVSH